jgi:hypothetical protein
MREKLLERKEDIFISTAQLSHCSDYAIGSKTEEFYFDSQQGTRYFLLLRIWTGPGDYLT